MRLAQDSTSEDDEVTPGSTGLCGAGYVKPALAGILFALGLGAALLVALPSNQQPIEGDEVSDSLPGGTPTSDVGAVAPPPIAADLGMPDKTSAPAGDAAWLRAQVAQLARGQTLSIPAGDYRLNDGQGLRVMNKYDVVIKGDSAGRTTLWFTCDATIGLWLQGCGNLTLKHINIDMDPPCFAQGVVTQAPPLGETTFQAAFQTTKQMPDEPRFNTPTTIKLAVFDPVTLRMRRANDMNGAINAFMVAGGATPTGARSQGMPVYSVRMKNFGMGARPRVGDLVTINVRTGAPAFAHKMSHDMTFKHINIYASGQGALLGGGAGGHTLKNIAITRRPNSDHLISSNADGIVLRVLATPIVKNCLIEFTMDDALNVNADMYAVVGMIKPNVAILMDMTSPTQGLLWGYSSQNFRNPNTLLFFDGKTHEPVNPKGKIKSLEQVDGERIVTWLSGDVSTPNTRVARLYKMGVGNKFPNPHVTLWQVEFSNNLAVAMGALVSWEVTGSGAIEGNTLRDGYSKSALLKMPNMLVKGNTMARTVGLYLYPEVDWMEGSLYNPGTRIVDNTITECGSNGYFVAKASFPGLFVSGTRIGGPLMLQRTMSRCLAQGAGSRYGLKFTPGDHVYRVSQTGAPVRAGGAGTWKVRAWAYVTSDYKGGAMYLMTRFFGGDAVDFNQHLGDATGGFPAGRDRWEQIEAWFDTQSTTPGAYQMNLGFTGTIGMEPEFRGPQTAGIVYLTDIQLISPKGKNMIGNGCFNGGRPLSNFNPSSSGAFSVVALPTDAQLSASKEAPPRALSSAGVFV